MKRIALLLCRCMLLGCFCFFCGSCKRLDGETLVEGQVVDRHTGEAIPNARLVMFSGKNSSSSGSYNTKEFEKQTDNKGNFSFKFKSDNSKSYILRAFKDPGYYTAWDDAAYIDEGRNNKKLKLKMQAPAWVRVKLVNVPPKDVIPYMNIRGFSLGQGQDGLELYHVKNDTSFIGSTIGNSEKRIIWRINRTGIFEDYYKEVFYPALDTVDFTIEY